MRWSACCFFLNKDSESFYLHLRIKDRCWHLHIWLMYADKKIYNPKFSPTCLRSFSMADITIGPLHTMGAASSTRKPMDILKKAEQTCSETGSFSTVIDLIFLYTHQGIPKFIRGLIKLSKNIMKRHIYK